MKELGIILLVAIAAMGILLIILLQKITILKKQTDDIVQEVKAYVSYVTAEAEDETDVAEITQRGGQAPVLAFKTKAKVSRDEAENHLIQAVLGDYFP